MVRCRGLIKSLFLRPISDRVTLSPDNAQKFSVSAGHPGRSHPPLINLYTYRTGSNFSHRALEAIKGFLAASSTYTWDKCYAAVLRM